MFAGNTGMDFARAMSGALRSGVGSSSYDTPQMPSAEQMGLANDPTAYQFHTDFIRKHYADLAAQQQAQATPAPAPAPATPAPEPVATPTPAISDQVAQTIPSTPAITPPTEAAAPAALPTGIARQQQQNTPWWSWNQQPNQMQTQATVNALRGNSDLSNSASPFA